MEDKRQTLKKSKGYSVLGSRTEMGAQSETGTVDLG